MSETVTIEKAKPLYEMPTHLRGSRFDKGISLGDLFTCIDTLLDQRARLNPDTRNFVLVDCGTSEQLKQRHCTVTVTRENLVNTDYYRVLKQYVQWANPTGWSIDFVDSEGSFGILLTGEFTCMVMCRADGSVSGHS